MKKTLKRTCAVMLALAATTGVVGVENVVNKTNEKHSTYAEVVKPTEASNKVLKISKYSKNVVLGEEFTMPTATFESSAISNYVVKTPSGKTFNQGDVTGGKFKVEEIGTYTITYVSGEYSGSINFESSVSAYSVTLETNNNKILPAKVGTNHSVENFYVPTYVVTDKNGEEVQDVDVTISVTTPDFKTLSVTDGKIVFGSETLKKGTYIVNYSVYSNGQFLASTKAEFKCVTGDAYEADDKLVLSYTKEKPESVNVGKTVDLPAVTAKIGTENVPVYYTIDIYKNGTGEKIDPTTKVGNTETPVLEFVDGVYKFTANEIVNYYTVKYSVTSALGEKTAEAEFVIDTVEDSLKPTPIVVEAYDKDDAEEVKVLKNVDYKLASNFDSKKEIKILPMYAEDLGTFNFADFTFKREIRNSSYDVVYKDEANANKNIIFNYAGSEQDEESLTDSIVAKDEDGENITLKDGTYYVYYTVKDKSGNENTVNYKFVVEANFDGKDSGDNEIKPVVTYNDQFFASVDKGEEISFGKVTFSDDKDARLETAVSYQYFNGTTALGEKAELELNSNSKYVINTENAPAEATKVVIYAWARNDSGFETTESKEVEINSVVTGTEATIVSEVASDGTKNQDLVVGAKIELPTITFWDDIVRTLDAEISISCKSGTETIEYEAQDSLAIRNEVAGTYTYANAWFKAATAGKYTVAVKATDAAGNVAIQFIEYDVADATYAGALRFTNIGLTDTKIELGDAFKLPAATIAGANNTDYAYEVRCVAGPTGYKLNNDRFEPAKVGEYTLQYVMYKKADLSVVESETVEVKVTVEDTTKPEIYVNWQASIVNDEAATGDILGAYEKGTKILLPVFSAKDLSGIDANKSMITITNTATSSTRTIKFADMATEYAERENGDLYYTFSRDGEYTITYTVYDKQGNTDKKVFTIKIGDLDAPEFEVKDSVISSKYNLGDKLTINLKEDAGNITFKDEADADLKEDISVVLKVNGTEVSNTETEDGLYSFDLNTAGSYELTFTVKDAAGNKSEVVKTFEIAEKGDSALTQTEVIGTVLIVVSVVVLAGVIVYFVISKRKMDKLYKS